MSLDEIPDIKTNYPVTITIRVTPELKRKVEYLRYVKQKDTSNYLRKILDDALKDIEVPQRETISGL